MPRDYKSVLDTNNVSWNNEALDALLKGPEVMGMWHNGLDRLKEHANSIAQTEGAEYESAVHDEDNEWGFDPGGYIYTYNYEARVDDDAHDTLLAVFAAAPAIIADAGRMDLGEGTSYAPAGRGSKVRGAGGRFVAADGIKKGG